VLRARIANPHYRGWLGYKAGCHIGEYYIVSKGSRHFFMKYGKSKKTCVEKKL